MQPVLGDMLTDLPEISSFSMAENADYKTDPQTPFQQFLRRSPPWYEPSREVRAKAADKFMESRHEDQRRKIARILRSDDGVRKVRNA